MKKYLYVCLVCLPVTLSAQSYIAKSATIAKTTQHTLARAAASAAASQHKLFAELLFRATPDSSNPHLKSSIVLTAQQHQTWLEQYQQLLSKFEQVKKESSPFLLYQSLPLEMREISTEEKRQWLDKLLPLHHQVLSFYLTTRQDPALKYALDYLRFGIETVDPFLVPALATNTKPLLPDFDAQAFFLYPPENTNLPDPSLVLDEKKIVMINDDTSLLDHFDRLEQLGILFPGAYLHTEGEPLQFLLWMKHTNTRPDVIFTDIQLGESNGFYLAHELRAKGYMGGIIALTSYPETEQNARQFRAAGFDGMVSLDERYYGKVPFAQRITQAAQLYLQQSKNK